VPTTLLNESASSVYDLMRDLPVLQILLPSFSSRIKLVLITHISRDTASGERDAVDRSTSEAAAAIMCPIADSVPHPIHL
jgi:hypothetical protein